MRLLLPDAISMLPSELFLGTSLSEARKLHESQRRSGGKHSPQSYQCHLRFYSRHFTGCDDVECPTQQANQGHRCCFA